MGPFVEEVVIKEGAVGPAVVGLVGRRNLVTELDFIQGCFRVVVGALHYLQRAMAV